MKRSITRRTRIHLIAASILLVAGVSLWHLASPEEPSSNETNPQVHVTPDNTPSPARSMTHAENLALRAELASLRGRVDRMQDELDDQPASPGELVADDGAPGSIDRYDHLAPIERDAAIAEDLEAVLETEPVDGEWSAETETQVAAAVADLGSAALVSVTCRQTLCRAELDHGDVTERDQDLNRLVAAAPFNTQGFVHMRASDPPESAIYFAREGHELPR